MSAFCQKQNIVMNASWIPQEVTASTVAAVKRLNSNADTANEAMAKSILMGGNSTIGSGNRQCGIGNPLRNVRYRFSGELKLLADEPGQQLLIVEPTGVNSLIHGLG